MSAIRKIFDKMRPSFEEGGKLHAFRSVFDGFETFALVPNDTSKSGVNIHDAIDSKRIMSMVVIALVPAMLFGMYNIGYQNYLAAGTLATASFFEVFFFGFLAVLPKILVSYIVGLGIEFAWAQWKGEEIQEGYLVSGFIIPLIIPIGCPLWMLALACAFSVIFVKEIFGGTGMTLFNPAIAARMFLFFAYPSKMTGDQVDIKVADERWRSGGLAVAIAELSVDEQAVVEQTAADESFVFGIVPPLVASRDIGTEVPVVALDDLRQHCVQLSAESA